MASLLGFDRGSGIFSLGISSGDNEYISNCQNKYSSLVLFTLPQLPAYAQFYKLSEDKKGYERASDFDEKVLKLEAEQAKGVKEAEEIRLKQTVLSVLQKIDTSSELQRAPFITQGDGQALSYQRKAEQALACLSDPAPVIDNYPWLKGDLVATGLTLQEVAQRVIDTRTGFDAIGALIEEVRLVAKDKVRTIAADEALSIDEKMSAIHQASEVDWSPIDTLVASWNT